ncbi:MAG: hypothetical protein ACR2QA_18240 [Solirubrobacteraceae bacterium]
MVLCAASAIAWNNLDPLHGARATAWARLCWARYAAAPTNLYQNIASTDIIIV